MPSFLLFMLVLVKLHLALRFVLHTVGVWKCDCSALLITRAPRTRYHMSHTKLADEEREWGARVITMQESNMFIAHNHTHWVYIVCISCYMIICDDKIVGDSRLTLAHFASPAVGCGHCLQRNQQRFLGVADVTIHHRHLPKEHALSCHSFFHQSMVYSIRCTWIERDEWQLSVKWHDCYSYWSFPVGRLAMRTANSLQFVPTC